MREMFLIVEKTQSGKVHKNLGIHGATTDPGLALELAESMSSDLVKFEIVSTVNLDHQVRLDREKRAEADAEYMRSRIDNPHGDEP
jgi:hypothetical protein